MTPKIKQLLDYINGHRHHQLRREVEWKLEDDFAKRKLTPTQRSAEALKLMLAEEKPAFIPGETIAFTRTVTQIPEQFTEDEWKEFRSKAYLHEKGFVFNISPDYETTLKSGLLARRKLAKDRLELANQQQDALGIEFLNAAISGIDAVIDLAKRYREEAKKLGLDHIAKTLEQVPEKPARTFLEALQFFRILHFTLWCEGEYHNGVGRFDQYMLPFLEHDLKNNILDEDQAFELLEEFFLTFNRDSDLYVGVQQGDNGQSLVLGGVDRDGKPAVNKLTRMCLKASCELKLIDPKINLRVSPDTPKELLECATELTREGLGFPQYSNDDVVIPGLVELGYELEDARDYAVAACWEFIIPGVGMDLANIGAVSLPAVIDKVIRKSNAKTFEELQDQVADQLKAEADLLIANWQRVEILPGPFVSTLCKGRIEQARDVCHGNKYNNFGIHGTGLATAVDSLAAIQKLVYQDKDLTLQQLVALLEDDFNSNPKILAKARFQCPKMGNDDDAADSIAVRLLDDYADAWKGRKNSRGGIYRPGTGSAMYYLWHADEIPASADGRLKRQPFPANYAPSLNVKVNSPVSVVKSFTKPNLKRVINGGPLTLELHDSTFREEDGIEKVAALVKYFVQRGGHQLQLNAVNRDTLLDAQKHPEDHKNLIVRVWGWSGYFIELDKPYQDHVIKRVEMTL
ncbi:MAG: pyruvate formate-lyase [Lentisphaerae bacterium]|jgi:pyruvate-formate lyase|nr:pyruvate formate-lyase [Lentisphaerota bacterium]